MAYACVYVYSPYDYENLLEMPDVERVDLSFGSDDGCAIWLNGTPIYREAISRPLVADNVRLEGLRLERGWNCLLFKVEDQVWHWGVTARILDKSNRFPPGIFVSPRILANE